MSSSDAGHHGVNHGDPSGVVQREVAKVSIEFTSGPASLPLPVVHLVEEVSDVNTELALPPGSVLVDNTIFHFAFKLRNNVRTFTLHISEMNISYQQIAVSMFLKLSVKEFQNREITR